jgi:hypothetical protein
MAMSIDHSFTPVNLPYKLEASYFLMFYYEANQLTGGVSQRLPIQVPFPSVRIYALKRQRLRRLR